MLRPARSMNAQDVGRSISGDGIGVNRVSHVVRRFCREEYRRRHPMIHYVFLRLRGKNALAAGSAFACPAHLKTASGPHWINQLRLGAAQSNFEPAYSSDALAQTRGSLLTGNVAVNRTVSWPRIEYRSMTGQHPVHRTTDVLESLTLH